MVVLPKVLILPEYRQAIAHVPCIAFASETTSGAGVEELPPHAVKKRDNITACTVILCFNMLPHSFFLI
jgi:hypothetical protein